MYQCGLCSRTFVSQKALDVHILDDHAEREVIYMERNNFTNPWTVHGGSKPTNWELALADELTGRKAGE